METANTPVEMFIQQAQNLLPNAKQLNKIAKKTGRERAAINEKFYANVHSLTVYTYMDEQLQQDAVVAFVEAVNAFNATFKNARTEIEVAIDVEAANTHFEQLLPTYNAMIEVLGYEAEKLNKIK